jgi:hypothetical protein
LRELCRPNLTLGQAALAVVALCQDSSVDYLVASPDLWNRRQDTGRSGFEILQGTQGMPPMTPADNRRIPGWRVLREYLQPGDEAAPHLYVSSDCRELIRCLTSLRHDPHTPGDCATEPHEITHLPDALRYFLRSRVSPARAERVEETSPLSAYFARKRGQERKGRFN